MSVNTNKLAEFVADMLGKPYSENIELHKMLDYIYWNASESEYKNTACVTYTVYQDQGIFSWGDGKHKAANADREKTATDQIENIFRTLNALGIHYTTNTIETSPRPFSAETRMIDHITNISYTVPEETRAIIWEIISAGKLVAMKRSSKGWAEKMEASEFAEQLVVYIMTIFKREYKNNPQAKDKTISLNVSFKDLYIRNILGFHGYIDYEENGYKSLTENDQVVGLRWVIINRLIDKLAEMGSIYTSYSIDDRGELHIIPHFSVTKAQEPLKEW